MTARTRRPLLLRGLVAAVLVAAWACSPGEAEPGAGEPDHEHEEADPGHEHEEEAEEHVLHLEPRALQAWGVTVEPVGRTTVSAEMMLPGVITTNENRTARIAPLVAGQVARITTDLGSRVAAGDTLAALNSPEFTRAQTAFLQAFTQAELSRKDYERAVVLLEQRALEEREFLRRQSTYEESLTELRAAEALLEALGVGEERMDELRAGVNVAGGPVEAGVVAPLLPLQTPISGVVMERDAVLGERVEPGHPLFTVSDLSLLWARLDAYEHHLPHLDPEAEIVVRSPLLPEREFPGRVTVVADQVDPELRTVRVRAEIPNPEGLLRPNMYVQGFLRTHTPDTERMVVPEDAVQLLEGEHVVFVERPPEAGEEHRVFEARHVVPGEILTVGRIIESGLDGDERIATGGAFTLKAELTRGVAGHQHVH